MYLKSISHAVSLRRVLWMIVWCGLMGVATQQAGAQDEWVVSGSVVDANGVPLIGVNVVRQDARNVGTVTDVDGRFTLRTTRRGITLTFSYIGYVTQDVVASTATLNVILREDTQALEEVIVVAYGTQKKTSLTGAVAAVGGEQLQAIPTSNLTNALAGRLGGVTIAQNQGGRPGNSSSLTVRARGTWNSTAPLYVIDGVVRDARAFDVLDASEVESVSVLKDASAASIYGARAANGVVLVQTKRGREGRPQVAYSGSVSVGNFTLRPAMETAMQHIAFTNDYEREYNINPNTDDNIPYHPQWGFHYWPTTYLNGTDPGGGYINGSVFSDDEIDYYRTHNYNLMDDVWQTPVTSNHAVSISGGNDRLTYFGGLTYHGENGAFETLRYAKYTVRGGLDARLLPGLQFSASFHGDRSDDRGPFIGNQSYDGEPDADRRRLGILFYDLLRSSPLIPGRVDGKYIGRGSNQTGATPMAVAGGAAGSIRDRYWNTEYTTALEYAAPFVKGLSAKVMYNRYTRQRLYREYEEPYLVYQTRRDGVNNHIVTEEILSSVQVGNQPSLFEQNELSESYQLNGFLTYQRTFGRHDAGAMLGFEQSENKSEWFNAKKTNYDIAGHPYFNYGPTDRQFFGIDGKGSEEARLSYIGRLNYAFDNRYLAEFSFRRDASVKFQNDRRWGFFPAGSVAWRIAEEGFIKNRWAQVLNNLKLRAAVGLTGNDAVGSWQYMDLANVGGEGAYYGGPARAYGAWIGRVANSLITWEKSLNYNAGLDVGVWNNLFTLGFDYYFRHTYDILGSQTNEIPDTFGATLADSNYGVVDSWGYEVELGFNKRLGRDLSLYAKANFSYAGNKLVEWAETGVPPHLSKIGRNWDRQYGYRTDGVVRTAVNNGDGTYTINGKYIVPETGYLYRGSNYDLTSSNKYAMRPGSVFLLDIGSSSGTDAEGNVVYTTTPDGRVSDDDADRTWIIDHYNPPYSFGLLLGGAWKGWTLDVFFQGLAGHQTLISTYNAAGYYWYEGNWEYWSGDHFSFEGNPNGSMPAPTNMGGHNMQGAGQFKMTTNHDMWVRDASFVRLKNVTLGYEINKQLLSRANISLARVYLTANNVALLYNPLRYFDPELAGTTNDPRPTEGKPGNGIYSYPLMRTITLGVNFNF
jgi:TonB-linked SusC/RagA family outer membrane protein